MQNNENKPEITVTAEEEKIKIDPQIEEKIQKLEKDNESYKKDILNLKNEIDSIKKDIEELKKKPK